MTESAAEVQHGWFRALIIAAGVLVAVGVAGISIWTLANGVRQAAAHVSLTSAVVEHRIATAAYQPVDDELATEAAAARSDIDLATRLAELVPDAYAGATEKAALVTATDVLTPLEAQADVYEPGFPAVGIEDFAATTLDEAAEQLRTESEWLTESMDGASRLSDELAAGNIVLDEAAEALFASVTAVEPSLEAASWVSTVNEKLAVRKAAGIVAGADFNTSGFGAMQRYVDAVRAMEAAHAAELATFAGPLYDSRIDALAFANSISGGVILEFEWVPELFGFGSFNGGVAAQATLEGTAPDFHSSIDLTDSIAELWPSLRSQSIIAHEVGHAITMKCIDIFNASAGGNYEAFATAWAIGMGYTDAANGTAAYGRPSDDLIAATMACR